MNLFDHLNNLCLNKKEMDPKNDEETKSYNQYIINRFISMNEIYLPLVNEINKYQVPKDTHQRFFISVLTKRKQWFSYIKKAKEFNIEEKKLIAKYFEIGLKEAEYYISFLEKDQLKEIINLYKAGTK